MHGQERPFLAPVVDLLKFGQRNLSPPSPPHSACSAPPWPTRSHAPAVCPVATTGGGPGERGGLGVGIRVSYDGTRGRKMQVRSTLLL